MTLRALVLSCCLLATQFATAAAPKEFWWTYLAQYDGVPGVVKVNLAIHAKMPSEEYPDVVITGPTYTSVKKSGLPEEADAERLDALAKKVIATVKKVTPSIYVGSFSYKYRQVHYIYLKHSEGVEQALAKLYEKECKDCKATILVKADSTWYNYRGFLFPNEGTIRFNKKELDKLGAPLQ